MTGESGKVPDGVVGVSTVPSRPKRKRPPVEKFEGAPMYRAIMTYFTYALIILIGHLSDFFRRIGLKRDRASALSDDDMFKMGLEFEMFYSRNIYRKVCDCFSVPICSCPGARVEIMDRVSDDYLWTFRMTGTSKDCINLGSYNYLGFAQNSGPCADAAIESVYKYGPGASSTRRELGTTSLVRDLEKLIARFVGKQDAIVFGMGFATNSTNLPALVSKGCLLVSDAKNHASLVLGSRLSGATIRVFKHNDVVDLESVLRKAIVEGQPRTHRPWKKILILVEGVYSMEGSLSKLPEIVELKKKYKAYLYIDEAHSIGAVGATGRGVTEYWGIDPADVDIMMGTFTKSFGSCGGYIAANHEVINHLRHCSHAATYGACMPAPVAQQIISATKIIMGEDGTDDGKRRIDQLLWNSRYMRTKLDEMGFIVYGNEDSPVIPILIYEPTKVRAFAKEMLKRNIALVVVGFPATSIIESRARICISASHDKDMLDYCLKQIDELGYTLMLKRNSHLFNS